MRLKRKKSNLFPSKSSKKADTALLYIAYSLLIVSILGYAYTSNILLGVFAFLSIVLVFIAEIKQNIGTSGMKGAASDFMHAAIYAIAIWIALSFILGTSSPINAVASCSMLPYLHRGDLVILHGIGNESQFIAQHDIPILNVSASNFSKLSQSGTEHLVYFWYQHSKSAISNIVNNTSNLNVGLYDSKCLSVYSYQQDVSSYYRCFVGPNPESNPIKYSYSIGNVSVDGRNALIIQTNSISVGNSTVYRSNTLPIVVYSTSKNDTFSGDIIHRVYAAVNTSSGMYLLTKGNNNPSLDLQFGNTPIPSSRVVGYVIADIPLVGYVKLLLSGQLATPAGCNQTITN